MFKTSHLEQVWKNYRETKDLKFRDDLLLFYAPLVKYVAGKISIGLPKSIDISDLISYGIFGLIDAIEKFDIDRKIKFETYAIPRIKGAIYDELRNQDWIPRSIRTRAKQIEKTYVELENRLQRVPSENEVAKELNITLEQMEDVLSQINSFFVIAFEDVVNISNSRDESMQVVNMIKDESQDDPLTSIESEEVRNFLKVAISKLNDKEKSIISLYYYEGLTLKEIGDVLGITESRVSQIHSKLILRLRGYLNEMSGSYI